MISCTIENGAVSEIFIIFLTENLLTLIIPRQNDRRQNTDTMPWWVKNRREKIVQLPKVVDRFKQYTWKKCDIDIRPVIKEGTIIGRECTNYNKRTRSFLKKTNYNKSFFGHRDPKQHTKYTIQIPNSTGQNQNWQITQQTIKHKLFTERNQINSRGDFLSKTIRHTNTGG